MTEWIRQIQLHTLRKSTALILQPTLLIAFTKATFVGGNHVAVKTVLRNYTSEPTPLLHERRNC
jgi:hypothetical protein